jgi:hypothetical protein
MPEYLEMTADKFTFRVAKDRLYSAEGVWVLPEPGSTRVRVGLADYLQQHNGDVAFANVKPAGTKLAVGGQEFSQPLEVRKDPNSGGSEAEITEQTKLLTDLQGDLNAAVEIVNAVEVVRGQLVSLRNLIGADTAKAAVKTAADSLDQKLVAVEETLVQLRVTGRGQDQIRWPIQTGGRLVYLANEVGGSDFAPTMQQREVAQVLKGEVQAARGRFEQVMKEVAAFNAMLAERKVSGVIIR